LKRCLGGGQSHFTPEQAGQAMADAQPRLGVIFHLNVDDVSIVPIISAIRSKYSGPVAIAKDLDAFEVFPTRFVSCLSFLSAYVSVCLSASLSLCPPSSVKPGTCGECALLQSKGPWVLCTPVKRGTDGNCARQ
jgi:hypothetical protein